MKRLVFFLTAARFLAGSPGAARAGEELGAAARKRLMTPVTIAVDNAGIRAVIDSLRAQARLDVVALDEILDMEETVTVKVEAVPAVEVIEALCVAAELDFHVTRHGVVALRWGEEEWQEEEEREEDEAELREPVLDGDEALSLAKEDRRVAKLLARFPGAEARAEFRPEWGVWVVSFFQGDRRIAVASVSDKTGRVVEFGAGGDEAREEAPAREEGEAF